MANNIAELTDLVKNIKKPFVTTVRDFPFFGNEKFM